MKLLICALIVSINSYALVVSFSKSPGRTITPGAPGETFSPEEMKLDAANQTTMDLYGTADEKITFSGNWEYNKGQKPNWTPLGDISPLTLHRNMHESYKIRCTTKPAYPLEISSVLLKQ